MDIQNVFVTINLILSICGAIIYGLATYWNIKFLNKSEKQTYSWIKIYSAIVCGLASALYIFIIISCIIGSKIEFSLCDLIITRPLMILIGGAFASSAKARLTSLKYGGTETWILRKSKN